MVENPATEASWHVDPYGRHEARWWNGTNWTEKVRDGNQRGIDPPGIVVAPQKVPLREPADPVPGRRRLRLFGKRLPGAMLLSSVALAGVVVLIIVVIVI